MLLFPVLLAAALAAQPTPPLEDARARQAAVEAGLLPAIGIEGRPPLRRTLAEEMAALHVPGVSIAVIHNSKVDWSRGYGVTRQGGPAVTADTLFQAGSVSKPVAAMTALRLVQDGVLPLDADVNATLKSWKLPAGAQLRPVTLRDLLSHTAATTVHGFAGYAPGDPIPTAVQVLDGAPPANSAPVVVDGPVGAEYRYSGGGYTIMQQMVIDASSQPFAAAARQAVFGPIGMNASSFDQPLDARRLAAAAWPHDNTGAALPGGPRVYPELAAAGLWTTANDLARFVIDLQASASGKTGHVLSPATAQAMLTPVKGTYGLGLNSEGAGPVKYFYHDGSNAGFKAILVGYPNGDGVVALSNGDQGYQLTLEVVRAVAAAYGWPDFQPKTRAAVSLPAGATAPYAGAFTIKDLGEFTLRRDGETLVAQIWKGISDPLVAKSASGFFALSQDMDIDFADPDHGTLRVGTDKVAFTRVVAPQAAPR